MVGGGCIFQAHFSHNCCTDHVFPATKLFSIIWVVVQTCNIQFFMVRRSLLPNTSNIKICQDQNQISLLFVPTCSQTMPCARAAFLQKYRKFTETRKNHQNMQNHYKHRKSEFWSAKFQGWVVLILKKVRLLLRR